MTPYIDVRGAWPVLVIGMSCWTLDGVHRSVSVADAIAALNLHEEEQILDMFR